MLINLSNHPSALWGELQLKTAQQLFGSVTDLPFPEIDPEWDTPEVEELAETYFKQIMAVARAHNAEPVVHLMGEYVFCFKLAARLKAHQISVLVSTSKRHSVVNADGTKSVHFSFQKFRAY